MRGSDDAEGLTTPSSAERRALRREKQRSDNPKRAAKMHLLRGTLKRRGGTELIPLSRNAYIGCSGWYYWEWRNSFYAEVPQREWFQRYADMFDTVELNASFYSWPTVANVQSWLRQIGERDFVYTIKVCELITHINQFNGTEVLIQDFDVVAEILGDRLGCFLYQLPPGFHYSKGRLDAIVRQLVPARRNVVEFRHASWWNEDVYEAFRNFGIIFCSCSGPRLPDQLVRTADDIYLRLHGPVHWYKHNYSDDELSVWAERIKLSGAKRAWIYFNNTIGANATSNAKSLHSMLSNHFQRIDVRDV